MFKKPDGYKNINSTQVVIITKPTIPKTEDDK